ncbi:MAG: tRNA (guanosine(37)-N1)-methyltransferase TrmD [Thermincola sp.]|jgi:tRNA (guanine37-N1)-methyltransferase|nr:tRNA (guanosine(37)-N1)-methyltransferase TrmD [Thermincola sp.]MDT3701495.1 tRNA (guanosine(37)-N1)-methyltransferase TrmD [Thermincola sp.]
MKIDILTLFPEMFDGPLNTSIIKRAREKGLININTINIRGFAHDKHRIVDDYPFGGGAGMVMKPEPIFEAVEFARQGTGDLAKVILLCPQGQVFNQEAAKRLANEKTLIFICGHYEGIDERVREKLVDEEFSIGDFVLTGGELPAMVIIDAMARLIPGVLGEQESFMSDSFYNGLLEYPQYTRPREYRGLTVPEILLSGDHEKIRKWRRLMSLKRTVARRPDLLQNIDLTKEDQALLTHDET